MEGFRGKALAGKRVRLFSSGPLDDSASGIDIPPVRFVRKTMTEIRARGHRTFGGRLLPGTSSALPVGDWRERTEVQAWASVIAGELAEVVHQG